MANSVNLPILSRGRNGRTSRELVRPFAGPAALALPLPSRWKANASRELARSGNDRDVPAPAPAPGPALPSSSPPPQQQLEEEESDADETTSLLNRFGCGALGCCGATPARTRQKQEEQRARRPANARRSSDDLYGVELDGVDKTWTLKDVVNSNGFHRVMIGVILLFAVFMGLQADYPEASVEIFGKTYNAWNVVSPIFLFIFILEISLRCTAVGCHAFFTDKEERFWNIFDFSLVVGGLVSHAVEAIIRWEERNDENAPGFAKPLAPVAQVVRVLRVLRVMRIAHEFKELRMLVMGLGDSMGTVQYIGALMMGLIFLSSILTTTVIREALGEFPPEHRERVDICWGSVGRSMFTFFQFLTLDDWAAVMYLVTPKFPILEPFFFAFIFFGAFVIMSVVTGAMADHMDNMRKQMEAEQRAEKLRQRGRIKDLVRQMDVDGSGTMNQMEFHTMMVDERVKKQLREAEVFVAERDLSDLFHAFDQNGDGVVDENEMYHGLKHLCEGLQGIGFFRLKADLTETVIALEARAERRETGERLFEPPPPPGPIQRERLRELQKKLAAIEERMDVFEPKIREFMKALRSSSNS